MTRVEIAVLELFRALPFAGFTSCAGCGDRCYCQGVNADSRICLECFEFVFGCTAPNFRRRRAA